MVLTLRRSLFLILAGMLSMTCFSKGTDPGNGQTEQSVHSPWPDEDAEMLALIMSGEIVAPRELYEKVQDDLSSIRSGWGETFPRIIEIPFVSPWSASRIDLEVDYATYNMIQTGSYTAWDSLNTFYNHDSTRPAIVDFRQSVALFFDARLNAPLLADLYSRLPGVLRAIPALHEYYGANIRGELDGDQRHYMFADSWLPCESLCWKYGFWEFYAGMGSVQFAGGWGPYAETLMALYRTPRLGFCPEAGELFTATCLRDSSGVVLLRGSWLREADTTLEDCRGNIMGCMVLVELFPRALSEFEVATLDDLIAAIPVEEHEIDGACDPCLVTLYLFGERVEHDNPCATMSAEYRAAVAALEAYLHDLAFVSLMELGME